MPHRLRRFQKTANAPQTPGLELPRPPKAPSISFQTFPFLSAESGLIKGLRGARAGEKISSPVFPGKRPIAHGSRDRGWTGDGVSQFRHGRLLRERNENNSRESAGRKEKSREVRRIRSNFMNVHRAWPRLNGIRKWRGVENVAGLRHREIAFWSTSTISEPTPRIIMAYAAVAAPRRRGRSRSSRMVLRHRERISSGTSGDMSRKAASRHVICVNSRVRRRHLTWKVSSCASPARTASMVESRSVAMDRLRTNPLAPASIAASSAFFSSSTLRAISFSSGKWLRIRRINPNPSRVAAEINHGQSDMELTRAFEQRNFIPHHHNRLELGLKETTYAFRQAKMPIRRSRTTSVFCRHLFISRSPPWGVPTLRANLGPGTRQHDLEDLLGSVFS